MENMFYYLNEKEIELCPSNEDYLCYLTEEEFAQKYFELIV